MRKFWRRILAILLILAMTAGDSAVVYAAEESGVSEETSEEFVEEAGEEAEASGESQEEGEGSSADAEEGTESAAGETEAADESDGDTDSDSEAEESAADDGDTQAEESGSDEADDAEVEIETIREEAEATIEEIAIPYTGEIDDIYEEAESGDALVSAANILLSAASTTSTWSGSFGAQLTDDTTAVQLYAAMEYYYPSHTALSSATYTFTLEEPVTFDAAVSGSSIVANDAYYVARTELVEAFYKSFNAFWQDYPEAFWLRGMSIVYWISGYEDDESLTGYTGYIEKIQLTASEYYDGAMDQIEDYWDAVEAIVDELGLEGCTSKYAIVKRIHDYLCDTITYNTAAANHMNENANPPAMLGRIE